MKKFFILTAVAFMTVSAAAQVVTSRTRIKSKSETNWYVRAGMSINNMAGYIDEDGVENGSKIGGDFDFGFQRNIGKSGLYWGMELGIGSRGFSSKFDDIDEFYEEKASMWNIKYSPFTIGYKYSITDNFKLDGHIGGFVSYDFAHSYNYKEAWSENGVIHEDEIDDWDEVDDKYNAFDAGLQVGIGAWWKRFNLDFTYQRGFVSAFDFRDVTAHSSNFIIRLGYAF